MNNAVNTTHVIGFGTQLKDDTTIIRLPDPMHTFCIKEGDRTLLFTARELFDALDQMLGRNDEEEL